jgi:hypothetical protein
VPSNRRRYPAPRAVRPDLRIAGMKNLHSLTVFHRPAPGVIDAVVNLHPIADVTLWLPHEFEHVIEQIESTKLAELARRRSGAWRSAEGVYETTRAVRAGRAVLTELRDYRAEGRVAE